MAEALAEELRVVQQLLRDLFITVTITILLYYYITILLYSILLYYCITMLLYHYDYAVVQQLRGAMSKKK